MTWKHTLNFYFYVCDDVAMRNLCNSNLKNKVRETFTFGDNVQDLSVFFNINFLKCRYELF